MFHLLQLTGILADRLKTHNIAPFSLESKKPPWISTSGTSCDKNWSSTSIGSSLRGFNLQVSIRIHYFNTQKFKVKIESGRKENELKKGATIIPPSIRENL